MREAESPCSTTVSNCPDGVDKMKTEKEVIEFAAELNQRFISVHGDIRSVDVVIDELLKKDDKRKRRFTVG